MSVAAPPAAAPVAPPAAPAPATPPPPAPARAAAVKPVEQVTDQQTGKVFKKLPEQKIDIVSAWFSAIYSIAVIFYLAFLVLYVRSGNNFWPPELAKQVGQLLTGPISRVILYTAVGGAMGAAVNNLRSFIAWHAEEKAFGWRFVWKYVAMPPLGGTLAVLVYGILQGGMAVINGGNGPNNNSDLVALSAWATGTLAGYGSSKVFIWLDDKVNTLFKIDKKQVAVPDLKGKSETEAKQLVSSAQLAIGSVSQQVTSKPEEVGKVIAQTPASGMQIDCGSTVDLTVGIAGPRDNVDPAIDPALSAASHNGTGSSSNGAGKTEGAEEAKTEKTATGTAETTDTTTASDASSTKTTADESTSGDESTTSDTTASDTSATGATADKTAATETTNK